MQIISRVLVLGLLFFAVCIPCSYGETAEKQDRFLNGLQKGIERILKKKGKGKPKDLAVKAIVDGNVEELERLIKDGKGGVGAKNKLVGGWYPLHIAAFQNQMPVVSKLLELGVDIQQNDGMDMSAADIAGIQRNCDIQEVLNSKLEDDEARAKSKEQTRLLLHQAVIAGYVQDTKNLVECGADVEGSSSKGWTPLHLAAYQGNIKLVQFFVDKQLNLEAADNSGLTPLNLAQLGGFKPVVELLTELVGADSAKKSVESQAMQKTFLESVKMAMKSGSPVTMMNLIGSGVDVNAVLEGPGWTALHICAKNTDEEIVEQRQMVAKVLLDNGADFDVKDNVGRRPVDLAQMEGNKDIVDLLVERGSSPEDSGVEEDQLGRLFLDALQQTIKPFSAGGTTPEHEAGFEKTQELLAQGANINYKDDQEKGWTALHWACLSGSTKVVQFLLDKGADADIQDKDGLTPLAVAQLQGDSTLAKLLQPHTTIDKASDLFVEAAAFVAEKGQDTKMRNLFENGANVNAVNSAGMTALHLMAAAGDKRREQLQFLLENQAQVDIKDAKGFIALHHAAAGGAIKIVEMLIDAGADPLAEDNEGRTSRDLADTTENDEVLEYLDGVLAELKALDDEMDEF